MVQLEQVVVTASPLGLSTFDLAQPVSVLSGKQLQLKLAPTLGETLNGEPGIVGSNFAPGASRPIIRGLADNRVLVLNNGTDIFDVSNLSPDHTPSVQPLLAQRIEVVRGAATILYGSSAIGGVVNVLDNRIPTEVPLEAIKGEIASRFESIDLERSGAASFDIRATDHIVLHIDGAIRRTEDLRIPDYALVDRIRRANSARRKSIAAIASAAIHGTSFPIPRSSAATSAWAHPMSGTRVSSARPSANS